MQPQPTTPSASADDEGLFCLECEYNLSGLMEDRCPECGSPFDRRYLRLIASGAPLCVLPWDDRSRLGLWSAFGRTCLTTWLRPGEFARDFPPRYSTRWAWAFSGMCYAWAACVALGIGGWVTRNFTDLMSFEFLCVTSGVGAAIVCESLLSAIFRLLLRPTGVPRQSCFHFWRGLAHFNSSYLFLSTVLIAGWLSIFDSIVPRDPWRDSEEILAYGGMIVVVLALMLWWRGLGAMVLQRSRGTTTARAMATLCIPLCGLLAICLGLGLAMLEFYLLQEL